jgi:kynurenine formamidase
VALRPILVGSAHPLLLYRSLGQTQDVTVMLRVVDLTRTLDEDTEIWPGTAPLEVVSGESIEIDGSFTRRVIIDEHSGTHFDAPSHFAEGAWHVAEVPAERLVCPVHVIDISARASNDPRVTLTVGDIADHEQTYGRISDGCAVFLRTDWLGASSSDRLRFPGFGVSAARMLVEQRSVIGLGIDTLGVDPGHATDFPIHREVTLPRGIWHVENLTGLADVPSVGGWAVIGVPRIAGASGFPARVFVIVPTTAEGVVDQQLATPAS